MDRMACVDLPALPLQLLLRRHPEWRSRAAAVVDADRPQGLLLWVNERARCSRIQPGMRYAAALALDGDLRAAELERRELEGTVAAIVGQLMELTPGVEPAAEEPGVFWLDASGLERLHGSLHAWACGVRSALLERSGLQATVVAGFGRFGTYAAAKARRGVIVFKCPDEERAAARRVALARLALAPDVRDALDKLGVRTVGQLADLPAEGLELRFGPAAGRLHRLATGELLLPLQPEHAQPPALERLSLDHPETSMVRLLAVIEQLIRPLLETLAARGQSLGEVQVGFRFERTGDHLECIRPAAPTLDAAQLVELIRLRLEAVRKLPDGVDEVVLAAQGVPATPEQLRLLAERPRRDLAAANRALARLRAALGDGAVTRARLREGHLPEGSFSWDAIERLPAPRVREVDTSRLIRRIYSPPVPLPPRPRHEPDGWMPRGLEQGPVVRVLGPYVVSGGWWNRAAVHREYHYAETQKGELLWVYYDRTRRRWYLHGRVE